MKKSPSKKEKGKEKVEKEIQIKVHIRWVIRRDLPLVLQIEQLTREVAWTEDDFLYCLRQRNCIGMVAELEDKVLGFMIYELHSDKLNVLNFAVDPAWQRKGIGSQMMIRLISKLSTHRRTKITVQIKSDNQGAKEFLEEQGFEQYGNGTRGKGKNDLFMGYRLKEEENPAT